MLNVSELRTPPPVREAVTAETVTIHDIVEALGSLSEALARFEHSADAEYLSAAIEASRTGERLFAMLTLRMRASRREENKETHHRRQRIEALGKIAYLNDLKHQLERLDTVVANKRAARLSRTIARAEINARLKPIPDL